MILWEYIYIHIQKGIPWRYCGFSSRHHNKANIVINQSWKIFGFAVHVKFMFTLYHSIILPTSAGSWKKQESSRKTSISAFLTRPKPLTVWITINCGKFWKRWECQTTWSASWETYMQVRKQQLELDMEKQTGSK